MMAALSTVFPYITTKPKSSPLQRRTETKSKSGGLKSPTYRISADHCTTLCKRSTFFRDDLLPNKGPKFSLLVVHRYWYTEFDGMREVLRKLRAKTRFHRYPTPRIQCKHSKVRKACPHRLVQSIHQKYQKLLLEDKTWTPARTECGVLC
ncbi:hypothetical protein DL98DRAFT_260327 [Cadophora sp. DSE1049]|nr:hypothetical protein DL98DRAFT_260327 [Cadophora sp. DSE1049]